MTSSSNVVIDLVTPPSSPNSERKKMYDFICGRRSSAVYATPSLKKKLVAVVVVMIGVLPIQAHLLKLNVVMYILALSH